MILTGTRITEEMQAGNITIEPFTTDQINPNSYNYRLGSTLKVFDYFDGRKSIFNEIEIPIEGYVLEPGQMYLGHTKEIIGSSKYAMSLIGRSSIGRYGLFLQVSANLGHTTSEHRWTLELVASLPIKLYPGMIIGQVSFWNNLGTVTKYGGRYGHLNQPQESFTPA
ncbi:MAG: deoxycytidine deaminase [Candidatus Uhrbacteria bacterium]|nr:deoxycytidine deaminase [Patescibacteria group bacterium]MBU1906947.1 deoxycytidine deaminase [Patescibacteria group bacterium]